MREAEARRARTLLEEEVQRFSEWLASLDVVPTIAALRELGDRVVEQVLHENEARWVSLVDEDRERVRVLARAIVSRLLHEPTLRLKGSAADGSFAYVQTLRELFGLDPERAAAPDEQRKGADVASLDERRHRRR